MIATDVISCLNILHEGTLDELVKHMCKTILKNKIYCVG